MSNKSTTAVANIALSPDERTVLLYCLDNYRATVANPESEDQMMLEALHLSSSQTMKLIKEIYDNSSLSTDMCQQAGEALWALQSIDPEKSLPIDRLQARLSGEPSYNFDDFSIFENW